MCARAEVRSPARLHGTRNTERHCNLPNGPAGCVRSDQKEIDKKMETTSRVKYRLPYPSPYWNRGPDVLGAALGQHGGSGGQQAGGGYLLGLQAEHAVEGRGEERLDATTGRDGLLHPLQRAAAACPRSFLPS